MTSNFPTRRLIVGALRPSAFVPLILMAGCSRERISRTPGDSAPAADSTPQASAGPGLLAYVTDEDSQELSVIDTQIDSVIETIAVGTRPRGVRVTPDGRKVYVALSGSPKCPPKMPDAECEKLKADKSKDGIAEVDASSRKVVRILPGGSDPENFDISKDGSTLFISNEDAGTASIVDLASGKIRSTVKVGREPEGVRVHPDGGTVWVTGETDHNVTIIDTKTGKVVGQIEVGKRPRALDFTPDGRRAYVTSEVDGTVWVIDVPGRKKVKVITMPKDSKPMGVAVTPDGKEVWVSNGRGGTVSVIAVASDSLLQTIPVGQRPWGIAITPDGRTLYTANGPSNDASVVDVDRRAVTRKIPVGKVPWGVAIGKAP